jgi:hypothetical protein
MLNAGKGYRGPPMDAKSNHLILIGVLIERVLVKVLFEVDRSLQCPKLRLNSERNRRHYIPEVTNLQHLEHLKLQSRHVGLDT